MLVVLLLDRCRHDSTRPDAVAAHQHGLLHSVVVQERRFERRRVSRAELEDVPDLDRSLETQSAATVGAAVTIDRLPDVCKTSR